MSIRFAGSRHVHDRRRRRLAQESDVGAGANDSPVSSIHHREADPVGQLPDVPEFSPLHSVIRPQLWIHWGIVTLCVGCWAGLLYVGDLAEQTDFGLKGILGIRSGRLVNFFSTIMLLWAGQLALLIYWFRRKSRNDFHGRYRMWLWVGVTLQFFLAVVATEAHVPFSAYMQRMWPLALPRYDLLSWLIPTCTLGLALFQILGKELRHCRCSRVLLWIAGIAGLVSALSLLGGSLLSERVRDLIQVGSATLAHMGLATSLLMHARYVIHVSNEAPQDQPHRSFTTRVRESIKSRPGIAFPSLPKLRLPSLKLLKRKPRARIVKSENDTKPTTTRKKQKVNLKAKPASTVARSGTTQSSKAPPTAKRRVDDSEPPKGPKASQQASSSNQSDDSDDSTRGLSKKERRRLRKQRQRQRTSSDSAR